MAADMLCKKKINLTVTELYIRGKILNISAVLIMQSYRLNTRLILHIFFILKIINKEDLQQNVFNHLSDIDFQDLMNLYKKYNSKPYSFLVIDNTLSQI